VQLLGERFGREHHGLGLLGRRVELDADGKIGRGRPGHQRARFQAAGQPVSKRP
jgi:hypothetical protein